MGALAATTPVTYAGTGSVPHVPGIHPRRLTLAPMRLHPASVRPVALATAARDRVRLRFVAPRDTTRVHRAAFAHV